MGRFSRISQCNQRGGGTGWGTHVNPWLIHVNVWQKSLQYCKVISLQLIKIHEKKKKEVCLWKKWEEQSQRAIERCCSVGFEDGGRKGPPAKECRLPPEFGKGKAVGSYSEPPEGMQPWWHLDFSPVRPILNFFGLYLCIYSSIVDIQCCVNFCCPAKWLIYTHIDIVFYIHFHCGLIPGCWI